MVCKRFAGSLGDWTHLVLLAGRLYLSERTQPSDTSPEDTLLGKARVTWFDHSGIISTSP
jgi:hypothetical protein